MIRFNLLVLLLNVIGSFSLTHAQVAAYTTFPSYLQTFDAAPSATQMTNSEGGFVWVPETQGRQGAVHLTRRNRNYINLKRFEDNYGRTVGNIGGEFSVECYVMARNFGNWMRYWDFSNTTVDANGIPNSNPTGETVSLGNTNRDPTFRIQAFRGTQETQIQSSDTAGRNAEWIHLAATFSIRNTTDLTLPDSGYHSLYVNGQLVMNATGRVPNIVPRSVNWIGRSAYINNGDDFFWGFYDYFAMYTYPLSAEAVWAHVQTSRPPVFELTFATNPTLITGAATPTYSWIDQDTGLIRGVVSFSGTSQSVNLFSNSGASSVGTALTGSLNGASSGSPSSPGWSYSVSVQFGAVATNAPVFDMKDGGTNRVRMYVNSAGNIIFSLNSISVTSSNTVVSGRYYHITATVSSTGNAVLYIDGEQVGTATGTGPSSVTYTTGFLGQSTDATPVFLNGRINAFRIYDVALTASEVSRLSRSMTTAPTGDIHTPRPQVPVQAHPVVSYSFSKPMGAFGQYGLSNFTWIPSMLGRNGMAFLDGSNHAINLRDFPDDEGKLMPTMFGRGPMSMEVTYQFLSPANQAMVWGFAGTRSQYDNNMQLMNTNWQADNQINSMKVEVYGTRGSSPIGIVFCKGCTNGTWVHAIATIAQPNISDSTSPTSCVVTLYMNGLFIQSIPAKCPESVHRPNLWLGQSGWSGDALFYGNIDSFHYYNYALSQEAVAAHYALPAPPAFEATFAEPAIIASPAYLWVANESTQIHTGMIQLAANQFINLSAATGPTSIGFTVGMATGTGRNNPGVPAGQANGWSFDVVFNAQSTAAGVTIVDIASAGGDNSINLAFSAADRLTVKQGSASIDCGSVTANTWAHVVVNVLPFGNVWYGQCYVNGQRRSSVPFAAVPVVNRTSILLGKLNTASTATFVGFIDAIRIMNYALVSEDVDQLYNAYSAAKRINDPPAYASGPMVSHTFDTQPQDFSDPTTEFSYSWYKWSQVAPGVAANASHTGVATFDSPLQSNALRQYLDLSFEPDAYGNTMPQINGGSMSWEVWINFASMRNWQRIFDCADNLGQDFNGGQGAKIFNVLLGCNGDCETTRTAHFEVWPTQADADSRKIQVPGAWKPGTWQHVVATVLQTSATNATMSLYLDGVLIGTQTTAPPPVRTRRMCYVGRSNWNDNALNGTVDSFYYYNYALTPTQVRRNMLLPNPPQFDASFETTPAVTASPTYGWVASDSGDSSHGGALVFNGVDQFVDLRSGSSANSIGQIFPRINGPSVGINQQGFSFELSCKWGSLTGSSRVFDLGSGGGIDSFALGTKGANARLYIHNGLSDQLSELVFMSVTANRYYHILVVATPIFNSTTLMDYKIYVSGALVATFNRAAAPLDMARYDSFIAKSTVSTDVFFTGSIDLLRYYTYAVSPDTASFLSSQAGTSAPFVPPTAESSSSTGATGGSSGASSSSGSSVAASSSSGVVASSSGRIDEPNHGSALSRTILSTCFFVVVAFLAIAA